MVKAIVMIMILVLFVSACSIGKTKPIVKNIEEKAEESLIGKEEAEKESNEAVKEKAAEESLNETKKNESEESVDEAEDEEAEEDGEEKHLPETITITIKGLKLEPQEIMIKQGDTVVWKHEDEWEEEGETRHYIAAHSNVFRSPILYYGDEFSYTFKNRGTFTYFDVLYKKKPQMRGEIIVE
ncbi:hypothetical protein KY358_03740 [Candidatus Woesearchaeota archaeon]|nr:hypothetical protein [Candidatus Woesearchaeota archaeon]